MNASARLSGWILLASFASFVPLVHAEPPGSPPASGPRLPRGKDMLGRPFAPFHWDAARGDLFVRGVSSSDVGQGNLGDCFFLSSLAAVAGARPELLKRAIRENRDGTFTVTFLRVTAAGVKAAPITVDAQLPATRRGLAFGRGLQLSRRGEELWPAIFEKAYATWKGGYHKLNQGGFADDALAALTGKRTSRFTVSAMSEERLWATLLTAARERRPIVTGTPSAAVLRRRTGRADQMGLIDDHAYAIVGARGLGAARTVDLYTPLTPKSGGVRRGGTGHRIALKLSDYRRLFDDLVVSR